ncbi:MAG: sugar ABC transporter permease [Defluviitaleaceae bacterium]|nr:sugar ABC transporter permease [Defluviitaleaceae bacterium]
MKKKKASLISKRQWFIGYMFMLPWILGFFILTAWPFIQTVYLSFFSVNRTILGWEREFVALENYRYAFFESVTFVPYLLTFVWMQAIYAPVITVISFILALLLNMSIKARGFFRAIFFLPVVVMSGPVMYQLLDAGGLTSVEIHNFTLWMMVAQFSVTAADALLYLFSHYTMMLWFTGIPIILLINALQKIDSGIVEAARIDSATSWQILWKITIPIIRPIFLVSMILTIVQLAGYTLNPVLPMIQESIHATVSGLGQASALAWIYSAVVLLIIGLAFLFLKEPKDKSGPEIKRRQMAWNER